MKKLLLREAAKHKLQNRRRKRWQKTVSILACLVVFCTVYALILPALTAEADTYCGKEEHTHTEDCYKDKLICGKEEGQGAHHHTDDCYREVEALVCPTPESDGHQHTEACYTEEQVLTCTNTDEGHVHSEFDSCYTTEKKLTCGMEEGQGAHHHTAECYETKKELICGQEENDGHRHTAECYEKELICGKEEHLHTLACYSNPNADVENGDVWQNTVSSVTLTGNWGADLAAIAQTQTGYTESTANYAVAEDGQTIHGYTRYGAWANDPYRDNWSAQFADFCLSYAGVPTSAVPQNSDCSAWNYTIPDGYTPKTGDLLLLDTDNNGSADHAGIVISADDSALTAIVGDADKAVRNNTYNIGSENIKGYVSIPENPALADDNNEKETTETTPAPEVTEEPQETSAPEITPEAEPTQEPEITPEAEPTQTPETTPEAEPTQVPEVTPDAEPTQTPETTPEAELTPTPELSVTPTPATDPEPSVIPTPSEISVPSKETKDQFQYENDEVKVTATLSSEGAIPADAEFKVTKVTAATAGYNYDAYMQALNNNAEAISPEQKTTDTNEVYNDKNTLLYDVAFLVDEDELEKKDEESAETFETEEKQILEENNSEETFCETEIPNETIPNVNANIKEGENQSGKKVEYQPAAGTVNIKFEFKNKQLTQDVNVEKADAVSVIHLPLDEETKGSVNTTADATDITAENVKVEVVHNVDVQLDAEQADFNLENFSLVAFVGADNQNENQQLKPGAAYDFQNILGNAIYYGVTCNNLHKTGHMDSNFATKLFEGSGSITIGKYTGANEQTNHGGVVTIAGMKENSTLAIDGVSTDVWCTETIKDKVSLDSNSSGQKVVYEEQALNNYVDSLMQYASDMSTTLAQETSYTVEQNSSIDQNNAEINISKLDSGTYYINGDWLEKKVQGGGLKIKKKSTQTVVFNFTGNVVRLKQFKVCNVDISSDEVDSALANNNADKYARTIVLNMPNAKDVYFDSNVLGIVLAPHATTHSLKTSSGWLVVDTVSDTDGEWHCVWSDMPVKTEIPVPYQLTARKTVDGQIPASNQIFQFKLEQYNAQNGNWIEQDVKQNDGGLIKFSTVQYNRSGKYYYRVSETGQYSNYNTDKTVYIAEVIIGEKATASGTTSMTQYFISSISYYKTENGQLNLSNLSQCEKVSEICFENTTKSLSVKKIWQDEDNVNYKRPTEISIQLMQAVADGEYSNYGQPIILNDANRWKYSWDYLPLTDNSGKPLSYKVVEITQLNDYTVQYENNDGVQCGLIVITNTLKREGEYVLPETGGIGTNRFTAMGLALMVGSLMCGYVMRRKRREGRRN